MLNSLKYSHSLSPAELNQQFTAYKVRAQSALKRMGQEDRESKNKDLAEKDAELERLGDQLLNLEKEAELLREEINLLQAKCKQVYDISYTFLLSLLN